MPYLVLRQAHLRKYVTNCRIYPVWMESGASAEPSTLSTNAFRVERHNSLPGHSRQNKQHKHASTDPASAQTVPQALAMWLHRQARC